MSDDPRCARCQAPLSDHDYDGACPWVDDAASIASWTNACADAQRTADSRRIVEITKRDRRRERAGIALCLLAVLVTLSILGLTH